MASQIRIDLDDYIGDFDDHDLARELRRRGYGIYAPPALLESLKRTDRREHGIEPDHNPSLEQELHAVRAAVTQGRIQDALAMIDRLVKPRFRDIEDCKSAYAQSRKAA